LTLCLNQQDAGIAVRWGEFASLRPDLADAGRRLLYQFGVGLAFLGTTRSDGGPRVHPMCPLLTESGLYAFIVPSPKRDDLHRDGRYVLHSFPAEDNEDAFYVTGRARLVTDEPEVEALAMQFATERDMSAPPTEIATWELFDLDIGSSLLTRTSGHGDPSPDHVVWHAPKASRVSGGS
jgi:hypothetical protein